METGTFVFVLELKLFYLDKSFFCISGILTLFRLLDRDVAILILGEVNIVELVVLTAVLRIKLILFCVVDILFALLSYTFFFYFIIDNSTF